VPRGWRVNKTEKNLMIIKVVLDFQINQNCKKKTRCIRRKTRQIRGNEYEEGWQGNNSYEG
jgi:hypothetical protein